MPEMMTKQDAIEYLLYMKHDVQAKSPMDIALDTAIKALKQPTIEPEVRHGRWESIGGEEPENQGVCCSECDYTTTYGSRFCPNCGARMDERGADNG